MNVVIANRQRVRKINKPLLKQITSELLAELKISKAELGINLVGALEMAEVNEKFLGHEGSTDVITFGYAEPESRIQNPESKLHGELFICVDEAILQAKKFKAKWQSEIVRYIVHGILHLLGHDDLRAKAKLKMKRAENRLLRKLSGQFSLAQLSRPARVSA